MTQNNFSYQTKREVVADLFSGQNEKINRALYFICRHPEQAYIKALNRFYDKTTDIVHKISCLRAICLCDLSEARKRVSKENFKAILENYFDPQNEEHCFNSLFIMYQLEIEFQPHIFESCLNHQSAKVRALAHRLLPYFEKKSPGLQKLLLRNHAQEKGTKKTDLEPQRRKPETAKQAATEEEPSYLFHEILKEILASSDDKDKINILMNLRENDNWLKDKSIYEILQNHFAHEKESFVLATLVKTYALSAQATQQTSEWTILEPYLQHTDKRLIANTIEAFCDLKEEKILVWLEAFAANNDFADKYNSRIISAGLGFLYQKSPLTAFDVMKKLAQSGANGIAVFTHHVSKWEHSTPELEKIVVNLIGTETKLQDLYPLAGHLAAHGSPFAAAQIKQMRSQLTNNEKSELLDELLNRLYQRLNPEEIAQAALSLNGTSLVVYGDLSEKISDQIGLSKTKVTNQKPPPNETILEEAKSLLEDWRIILLLLSTLLTFIFVMFVIYSSQKQTANQFTTISQPETPLTTDAIEQVSEETAHTAEPARKETAEIAKPSGVETDETTKLTNTEAANNTAEQINTEATSTAEPVSTEAQTTAKQTNEKTDIAEETNKEASDISVQSSDISIQSSDKETSTSVQSSDKTTSTTEQKKPFSFDRPPPVRTHHIEL